MGGICIGIFIMYCFPEEPVKTQVIRDYCKWASVETVSRKDTKRTQAKTARRNAKYRKLCKK